MTEDNLPQANRRTALKTIGAGMLAVTGPMVGSAAARSPETVVFSIQRNQDNGIDAAEYDKILSRFIQAAKKKAGLEKLAIAKPELSTGEKIYSLIFVATPDGKARTYIGSGVNPGDSELAQLQRNSTQYKEQVTASASSDNLGIETVDPEPEWGDPVGSGIWEKVTDPYGTVQNSSSVWNYDGDPNYDVYSTTTNAVFNPGFNRFGSNYQWTDNSTRHYWGRHYEPGGTNLTDWGPKNDNTGSGQMSATFGASVPEVTVSYEVPRVIREDLSRTTNDNARWVWRPGKVIVGTKQLSTSSGSIMKADNYASPGDTLVESECRLTVNNGNDEETLSSPLALEYE
ncbi:hypothetical protein [Halobacterium rubrum]|uniref:hypothetical protein n=1 Tax=Halobacterium TaxID=2239 RepID=UPI001F3719DD|nr:MULTISPECIES: hypothetical protein [Halobacterium]MDH5021839.1 hypothetical protein [Halobacterium rubrum]